MTDLQTKQARREVFKLWGIGVLVGVVLLIAIQILNEIFETPAFFGVSIMLLSLIVVSLGYLVDLKVREECERRSAREDVHREGGESAGRP
jgi:Na+/citrate or Na+/malate symporter